MFETWTLVVKTRHPKTQAQPCKTLFTKSFHCKAAMNFRGAEHLFPGNDRAQHFCVSGLEFFCISVKGGVDAV